MWGRLALLHNTALTADYWLLITDYHLYTGLNRQYFWNISEIWNICVAQPSLPPTKYYRKVGKKGKGNSEIEQTEQCQKE